MGFVALILTLCAHTHTHIYVSSSWNIHFRLSFRNPTIYNPFSVFLEICVASKPRTIALRQFATQCRPRVHSTVCTMIRPIVLLIRVILSSNKECSNAGMILKGENRSTGTKTCPNTTLSTTNLTWTDVGLNPGLRGERPGTDRLSHLYVNNYKYGDAAKLRYCKPV